jgi:hypothetical protein
LKFDCKRPILAIDDSCLDSWDQELELPWQRDTYLLVFETWLLTIKFRHCQHPFTLMILERRASVVLVAAIINLAPTAEEICSIFQVKVVEQTLNWPTPILIRSEHHKLDTHLTHRTTDEERIGSCSDKVHEKGIMACFKAGHLHLGIRTIIFLTHDSPLHDISVTYLIMDMKDRQPPLFPNATLQSGLKKQKVSLAIKC